MKFVYSNLSLFDFTLYENRLHLHCTQFESFIDFGLFIIKFMEKELTPPIWKVTCRCSMNCIQRWSHSHEYWTSVTKSFWFFERFWSDVYSFLLQIVYFTMKFENVFHQRKKAMTTSDCLETTRSIFKIKNNYSP